jgi:hypothetical protein
MPKPSKSDPPSSIDTMQSTSVIGTVPTDWGGEEEVNTENDRYQGAYNVGIEVDDDDVFVTTPKRRPIRMMVPQH